MINVMKVLKSSVLLAGMMFTAPSWAYVINGTTDVGGVDNLVAITDLVTYSVAEETAWVESVLGVNVTLQSRPNSNLDWIAVDGQTPGSETIFAQALQSSPDYYLLRLTGNNVNGNDTILYENVASLAYAVIDLVALGMGSTIDIYSVSVSHINQYNVPEPASLALLGIGILGMGFVARRKSKNV